MLLFLKLYSGLYIVILLYVGLTISILYIDNLTKLFLKLSNSLLELEGFFIVVTIVNFYKLGRLSGFSRGARRYLLLKRGRRSLSLRGQVSGYDVKYYSYL
jgi:hypothetical protein